MADPENDLDMMAETPQQREQATTDGEEREQIRNSNDRDQQLERDGVVTEHNRGYDAAVRGQAREVDPDSASSEVDRDDTLAD